MRPNCLLVLLVVAAGCGGDDFTPTLEHPWRPGGSPGDPSCAACEDIADIDDAHLGGLVLYHDPTATDELTQFDECARSVIACWTDDADLSACVAASVCPRPCRDEYARLAGASTDVDVQLAAVDAVFLDDGAPCRQPRDPAGEEVSP